MARTPVRTVRVPDDLWEQLRVAAAAEDRPMSYVIVKAIRAYLARAPDLVGAGPPRP